MAAMGGGEYGDGYEAEDEDEYRVDAGGGASRAREAGNAAACFSLSALRHRLCVCEPRADHGFAALAAAAAERGMTLKRCPRCGAATERAAGCLNMSCSCGHRYCWICLRPYPCPAGCGQRGDKVDPADIRAGKVSAPPPPPPPADNSACGARAQDCSNLRKESKMMKC